MELEFKLIGIIRVSLEQAYKNNHINRDTYYRVDNLMSQFLKLDEVLNISKDDNLYIWNTLK